ncbi:ImpA family type VI secretion system protein [Photobacterium lipolyticum]|uniref:ImpA N-terminal domain-containing protein n=1 Tax=Photobacterium lipolyticum TaxID=266810 RepID=A0A2T3N0R9_9GAMM|nr:type VI secretion system ImpA family N-terminal domain-containing protein [Photobacterium lipolyticum]PSW05803.1 hypothetical protein C9I89_08150 [Photobacterium lipolyticum]
MKFSESQRQSLLSPLEDDNFCGLYLKSDRQAFRPLRNEFNLAQTSLRKLTQNPDPSEFDALFEENKKNWNVLSNSLGIVFANSSRDIELTGWMMAAQVVIDPSLSGAKETALWLQELVSVHWDSLQPVLPDSKIKADNEDDKSNEINAFKVKAFIQLVGESEDSSLLYSPFLMTPLIGDLDYSRYQSEEYKGNLPEIRSQYHNLALTDKNQVIDLIDNLNDLKNSFVAIEQKVTEIGKQCLQSPVGFKFVIGLINKMLGAIEFISGLKPSTTVATVNGATQEAPAQIEPQAEPSHHTHYAEHIEMAKQQAAVSTVSFASLGEQQAFNRDQVFHQLRDIADYFRQTEPHSPVAYLLEKAIRWGYMPLPELMGELLLNQQDTIERVFNLTGLDEEGQVALPEVNRTMRSTPVFSTPIPAKEPDPVVDTKPVSPVPETEKTNNQEPQKTEQKSKSSSALQW